jgi:hypothetical protein
MNQKGKKSIVDALVNVAESKNDCVKESSKKISLSFRSKVKQGSSFIFKSVRTAVRSTSPIKKEVTISDLLTSTEISGSMNDVIIPSIEVDRISHLKRVKQVVKEALFGKGNQASLNQGPNEKVVLENQSSMLQYLEYVRNAIFFHFYLLTTRPVFYAFTYPIQMGVLLALLGSILINVSKFLYPALLVPPTQVTPSDSISEIESQDSVQWKAEMNDGETQVNQTEIVGYNGETQVNRTQVVGYDATSKVNELEANIHNATMRVNELEAKIHDAQIESIHAEAAYEMIRNERDFHINELEKYLLRSSGAGHQNEQKQASYFNIGPPGAQADDTAETIFEDAKNTLLGAFSNAVNKDPTTLETTEKNQAQVFQLVRDSQKLVNEAHGEVVRAKDQVITVTEAKGIATTKQVSAEEKLASEKEFPNRCNSEMNKLLNEAKSKYHTTIEAEAAKLCAQDQTAIHEAQNILKSELCNSRPSLCLDHLKNLLPIEEGYPQRVSLWQKFKNIFTK